MSQTEEEMYCRQEKSYGGELVTQIFMNLKYLNFSISFLPVLANEYQMNSCINHRIVIYLYHFEVSWYII